MKPIHRLSDCVVTVPIRVVKKTADWKSAVFHEISKDIFQVHSSIKTQDLNQLSPCRLAILKCWEGLGEGRSALPAENINPTYRFLCKDSEKRYHSSSKRNPSKTARIVPPPSTNCRLHRIDFSWLLKGAAFFPDHYSPSGYFIHDTCPYTNNSSICINTVARLDYKFSFQHSKQPLLPPQT